MNIKEEWDQKMNDALAAIGFDETGWRCDDNESCTLDGKQLEVLAELLLSARAAGEDFEVYALYSSMYDILDSRESPVLYNYNDDGTTELRVDKLEWREDKPLITVSCLRSALDRFEEIVGDDNTVRDLVGQLCDKIEFQGDHISEEELYAAAEVCRGMEMVRHAVLSYRIAEKERTEA